VTESAFMHDPEKAMETIHHLTHIGFHLSIDDFGVEYSALSLLKTLQVHELKIDKSFLEEIMHETRVCNLVESIISLGHSINIKIVAEGIENIATYNLLKDLKCDLGQGYLFSEPLRSEELIGWLKNSPWGMQ
jgi:EAL domain-containing protein (putative c-di-GMP-specific phosphodiesterase class I)